MPNRQPSIRVVAAIAFLLTLGSLASALFSLMRDKGHSNRTVRSLIFRVDFSITLFIFILVANRLGRVHSTNIQSDQ